MSTRQLRDWLSSYIEYTSYLEAPEIFHFWTGVSTIASALRRKVCIDQYYFSWTPNFYIILVARPGIVAKTTTITVGESLLRELGESITFGPDSLTWQALLNSLAQAKRAYELEPGGGVFKEMSCVSFSVGEFGTFFDPENRDLIDALTALWDGKTGEFERRTKTTGSDSIVNPWVNIIACTTPAWIQTYFPQSLMETGFSSRTLYLKADKKRHFEAYPILRIRDSDKMARLRASLISDLEMISTMVGAFHMTSEAYAWGARWYEDLFRNDMVKYQSSEAVCGYLSRKQTHLHKLAMVLSASCRQDMTITADDLDRADKILRLIEPEMFKVYDLVSNEEEIKKVHFIVDALRGAGGRLPLNILYKLVRNSMGYEDFRRAFTSCVEGGRLAFDNQTQIVTAITEH
jgi:hypothetical protein